MSDGTRLYSPASAAAYLDVGRATIYRLMNEGVLRSIKVGRSRRFTQEALDDLVRLLEAESRA